ncbi:MAG: ABC transporter ATP-binding protein [Gammaproteobacteria bacterium]
MKRITPGNESRAIVEFHDVRLRFGAELVYDRLSFSVCEGEFLCILGPSGCGKSTSLRVMGDLLQADSGRVSVNGRSPADGWQQLAYVFQSPRLAPWRDALGNVALAMELRFDKMDRAAREARAAELLELVGLGGDRHKFPAMLSGGERQRVSIARALAVDPQIILMDEPFSALDLNTRRRLRIEMTSIWERTGKTIVFVTHDIEEALVLADRIVLLSNKPTRVLEEIEIRTPRPRDLDESAQLRTHRDRLHTLFATLDTATMNHDQEETTP